MLIAVVKALAELARLPVPREVLKLYNLTKLEFGVDYILPTPFDPRLIEIIPLRVAEAARENDK
jgi:malate dehydrogenase (oxaloacetate-decarboxylating)(NADP+)